MIKELHLSRASYCESRARPGRHNLMMRGIKVPHPSLLRMPIWLHSEIIYTASRIFGPRRDQLQFTIYSMTLYPGRSVLLHSYLIFPLNTEWLQKVHYIAVSHLNDTELFYTRYWYIWDSLNGTLDKIGHGTWDNIYWVTKNEGTSIALKTMGY